MSEQEFSQKKVRKRVEALASKDSSFYTLSNRLIMPMLLISVVTAVPISRWPFFITICIVVCEIVIRYVLSTTLRDLFRALWFGLFGSKRKNIKN
jgi:hypothetical protein